MGIFESEKVVQTRGVLTHPESEELGSRLLFDLMDLKFRHDLPHENGRNSLNFLERGHIFWTFSYLYVFEKSYLAT